MNFSFKGIRVNVSYLFVCMLAVFTAVDRAGLFCPLLISIIMHELAHVTVLCIFGCRIRYVKLTLGSVGVGFYSSPKRYEELISLLSGPCFNLISALIFYLCKLKTLFAINLVLGIVNLLPVSGLDGWSIIEISLEGILSEKHITLLSFVISSITILIIMYCGYRYLSGNISVMIFCLYLFSSIIVKNLLKERRN